MDIELLRQLRNTEEVLDFPLIPPEVEDVSNFELSEHDIRLGLVWRVGEIALTDDVEVDSVLTREEKTHLHLLYNLERHIAVHANGNDTSLLREHQRDVFEDIYRFLAQPTINSDGSIERRGYIALPTGSGKTAIFSTLVNVLNRPFPEIEEKPKALVLVPKLDLISQTVGSNGQRGFAQFAQDTTVTEYHGRRKDLSGDAVVMSYQSLIGAVERGDVSAEDFALVICDEAHRALGDKTREALEQIANGNLLIGMTASPEFSNKHVKNLFSQEIHSMELREAIEMQLLSPIRCFAITSDAEIEKIKSGEFSEKELAKLIDHEWRNRKSVEFAKAFIEEGKSGIISCVPGDDTRHAVEMAKSLNDEMIIDPKNGELRRIRAIALSGKTEDRERIYEAFERGEFDVLSYVDVLTEGWDSTQAKFLINMRPTTSPVNAIQRLGRILRKSDNPDDIATVIEFIDKSDKQLFTFFHALGEEIIEQGKVYGKKGSSDDDEGLANGEGNEPGLNELIDSLPQDLRDKLAEINYINIGELVIQPDDYELPNGVVSISRFCRTHGVGPRALEYIIKENGFESEVYLFGDNKVEAFGLTVEQQEAILTHPYFNIPYADESVISIHALSIESGYSRSAIKSIIKELGINPGIYRFNNSVQGYPALTMDEKEQLLDRLIGMTMESDEGVISLNNFVKQQNTSREQVMAIAEELGIPLNTYFFRQGGLRSTIVILPDDISKILDHPHFSIPKLPEDAVVTSEFKAEFSMEMIMLKRILKELGIEQTLYRRTNSGHRVNAIKMEDAERVRAYVQEHMPCPPEGVTSINEIGQRTGLSVPKLLRAVDELSLARQEYRFVFKKGSRMSLGFNEEDTYQLIEYAQTLKRQTPQKVEASDNLGVVSIYTLSRQLGVGEAKLREAIADQGIETMLYLFANKPGLGMSTSNLPKLLEHPSLSMPLATKDDVSLNIVAKEILEIDPGTLRTIMKEQGITGRILRVQRGRPTDHLTLEEIERIKEAEYFSVKIVEGTISVNALSRELQTNDKTLIKLAEELGIKASKYKFLRGKSYSVGSGYTKEQQEAIRKHPYFSIPYADETVLNINKIASEIKSTKAKIVRVMKELDIELREYKFGTGKVNFGLSEDDLRRVKEFLNK